MIDLYFTDQEYNDMSNPILTLEQLILIREKTPKEYIEEKIDKYGNRYKSVKGSYVKRKLNLIFGFNWDFFIKDKEYLSRNNEVIVTGKLIVRTKNGSITKEQFGKYTFHKTQNQQTNRPNHQYHPDLGNAYKSAATDALKKCASEIGICWDIYSQETIQINSEDPEDLNAQKITEKLTHFLSQCKSITDIENVIEDFSSHNDITEKRQSIIDFYKDQLTDK